MTQEKERFLFFLKKREMKQEDSCLPERAALLDLFTDLQRLATADQTLRRNELLALLREIDFCS